MPVFAILNRIAGGGWASGEDDGSGKWLLSPWFPGKALYYVAPVVGLIAFVFHPWQGALAWAAAYLIWRLPPWGRWLYMSRKPIGYGRTVAPNWFERYVESISFGSGRLAMYWRMQIAAPGIGVAMRLTGCYQGWELAFPVLICTGLWACYELSWTINDENPIPQAEMLCGALWGAMILAGP